MKNIGCVGLAVLLSGCAATTPYLEPISGPTASLKLTVERSSEAGFLELPANSCDGEIKELARVKGPDTPFVLIQLGKPVPEKTIKIPAGKPFKLQAGIEHNRMGGVVIPCWKASEFTPEAGAEYVVNWSWPEPTKRMCELFIAKVFTESGIPVFAQVQTKNLQPCH